MAAVARWCFRHRLLVLLFWVVGLGGLVAGSSAAGTAYSNSFTVPGADSEEALTLLQTAFPGRSGESDTIVWHVDSGTVREGAAKDRITAMLERVADQPAVAELATPFSTGGDGQISQDGRTAFAVLTWRGEGDEVAAEDVRAVFDIVKETGTDGLQVALGGNAVRQVQGEPGSVSALLGIVAAAVVLLIAFGSLLAMLLPVFTAVIALVASIMAIGLLSHAMSVSAVAPTIAALVGLGVAIDYALFIVTRHRDGLKSGLEPEEAAVRAFNTSGRAVVFAGATVGVAMLGLLVLGMSFVTGIGVAAALTVAVSVLAAVTLLPALLGLLGHRVISRRERRRSAAAAESAKGAVAAAGVWQRWAGFVQRHPLPLVPLALVILIALNLPVFSLRMGSADQGNDPAGSSTRRAYDMLAAGFGPGFNGPLQLVADAPGPDDRQALEQLTQTVATTPGVASAALLPAQPGTSIGIIHVVPTTAPQDTRTSELIRHLRQDLIPAAEQGRTLRVHVGGQTAIFDDFGEALADKLPLFLAVIVGLGFLLLMVTFRSLLIPLTAAVMNLLAAGASLGAVIVFFQWGWGSELFGLGKSGPVESPVPVMMLAILFGLSMDYQVFLVSRMHEEWLHSRDNGRAVTIGQAATGRVITAAAAIMIFVFLAFVLSGERIVAEFGVGLASAVFIDAFILRTVLVPALMHLFGRANWWLPGWLDRILPHVSLEGTGEPAGPAPRHLADSVNARD